LSASRIHQASVERSGPPSLFNLMPTLGVVGTVVVAEVTKNLSMKDDAACLFIDLSTPQGKATGLVHDSVVSCLLLVTVYADTVAQVLGKLSPVMKQELDGCLRAALELS
jgi:hypothetical protein